MKCPRDNSELEDVRSQKKTYKRCPTCQGHFVSITREKLQGVSLSQLNPKLTPCALSSNEEALLSPKSGKPMKRFIFKGIQLDYCEDSNSVWMDKGELDSIAKKMISINKKQNKQKSSKHNIRENAGDGVLDVVLDIIGGLFDGI